MPKGYNGNRMIEDAQMFWRGRSSVAFGDPPSIDMSGRLSPGSEWESCRKHNIPHMARQTVVCFDNDNALTTHCPLQRATGTGRTVGAGNVTHPYAVCAFYAVTGSESSTAIQSPSARRFGRNVRSIVIAGRAERAAKARSCGGQTPTSFPHFVRLWDDLRAAVVIAALGTRYLGRIKISQTLCGAAGYIACTYLSRSTTADGIPERRCKKIWRSKSDARDFQKTVSSRERWSPVSQGGDTLCHGLH